MRPLLCLLLALCPTFALSQTEATARPAFTMEWINGPVGAHIADVPKVFWTDGGKAVIYDDRVPELQRTFTLLDPAGQKASLTDAAKALASLATAGGSTEKGKPGLPWPEGFDPHGDRAVFLFNDDVFVLDLAASTFTRVTKTPEDEKAVQFSPDGKSISYVRANDLYLYDVAAKIEKRLTHDGSATLLNGTVTWVYWEEIMGRRDIGYWWSPDSKSLVYLQTDESPVSVSTFVDFKPQNERVITQRYPKPGQENPKVRVGVLDLASSATKWVSGVAPYEWVLNVKWMPDSSRFSLQTTNRAQNELRLDLVDRQTAAGKRILTDADPAWINVTEDIYFLKDGHFLFASERDGYMHLYRYRADGTLENRVTNGDWAMASYSGVPFWVRKSVVGIDEQDDWIYFTALRESSVERHLYRVKSDGSGLTKLSAEAGAHRITMSPDARYYFDAYSNIKTLPALRLHGADGRQIAVVAPPRPQLFPAGMQYAELLTTPAADGFKMPAQILKPRAFDPKKKYPVILHIYGGPSAPTVINAWQPSALFENVLANDGYVMVAIDNRAATGISKTLENTLFAHPAESETADLVAGIKWLKAQPWVDASRVGVYGWSGGGTNTLNLMTRSKEFKAGISGAPVTDWLYYDSKWAESLVKLPSERPQEYESTSLVKRAQGLSGRLMLIWGTYDDNVHPQNEQAFIEALIQAGKPFEMMNYPMRKHGFEDTPAKIHRDNTMRDFWRRSL